MSTQRDIIQKDSSMLRLDRNECICPSVVREVIKSADIQIPDYYTYKSSYNILNKLAREINVEPGNLYINNGSETVLKNIIEVVECEKWYFTAPTFELFPFYCDLNHKKTHSVPYTFKDSKFSVDLNFKDIKSGIYLVSPHNPTGHTLSIQDIVKISLNFKYVVVDQAYLSPLDQLDLSLLPNNLIIVRTFSKLGGLTGMRFGYCVSSNTNIVFKLNQHRPMFLNSITLKLVDAILDTNSISHIIREFNTCVDYLKDEFLDSYILNAGNFMLLSNVSTYKGLPLKKYTISNNIFYRLTLFDLETYKSL